MLIVCDDFLWVELKRISNASNDRLTFKMNDKVFSMKKLTKLVFRTERTQTNTENNRSFISLPSYKSNLRHQSNDDHYMNTSDMQSMCNQIQFNLPEQFICIAD